MADPNSDTLSNVTSRPAEAPAGNSGVALLERFLTAVGASLRSPRAGALVVLAAVFTVGVGLILLAKSPDLVPLGSQPLGIQESARAADALASNGVNFSFDESSGLLLVDQKMLGRARMLMAGEGVLQPSAKGLELLHQEQRPGTSQFIQSARYQHALETELSRTISRMRHIQQARVHLALPKQTVFVARQAVASASVMLQQSAGRQVDRAQVAAIVNLVASSVPYLESGAVTVVDQWGQLLTSESELTAGTATEAQFDYARNLERLLSDRIRLLLEPIVGVGKVRASVTADIDFSTNEETAELFDADPTQLRSEQTSTQNLSGAGAGGVAGALSNQPGPGDQVSQVSQVSQGPGGSAANISATRNYEIDRTIRHTRRAPGRLVRLSAAVVLDSGASVEKPADAAGADAVDESRGTAAETDAAEDDAPAESAPLNAALLQQIELLAQEAIGFDAARGDSVYVVQQPFLPPPAMASPVAEPWWQDPSLPGLLRQLGIAVAGVLLLWFMVLPAVRTLAVRPAPVSAGGSDPSSHQPQGGVDADGNSITSAAAGNVAGNGPDSHAAMYAEGGIAPPDSLESYADILQVAKAMSEEDPARVARVVRRWVEAA